jgi:hypothetical protein
MPCQGAALRLSAAISNARRQLRSARTLLAAKKSLDTYPARRQESIRGVSSLEKKYRTPRAGGLGAGVQIKSPPHKGFPTSADRADRSRWFSFRLAPTVPCLARLYGYQRPPREEVCVGAFADHHLSPLTSLVSTLVGPARPYVYSCNYLFLSNMLWAPTK